MSREGKAKVLSQAEFKRVIAIVRDNRQHSKRNIAMLYISFGLGLRVKEISSLKINDILNENGSLKEEVSIRKDMTKGNNQRFVYLTNKKIVLAIQDYLEERKKLDGITFNLEAPLFRSQKGSFFTPNSLQQVFHRIYRNCGLEGCSSHSGRRTFATRMIENGTDIKAVSNLMGHKSINMTARYVEDNPQRLKKIASTIF